MRYVSEEYASEAKEPYHLFSEVDGLEKLAEISNRRYIEVISSWHYNTEFY